MNLDKYHVVAATVGGLLATVLLSVLSAAQATTVEHYLGNTVGIAALVAVGGGAMLAVFKKRSN
jgi:hypothetical protein